MGQSLALSLAILTFDRYGYSRVYPLREVNWALTGGEIAIFLGVLLQDRARVNMLTGYRVVNSIVSWTWRLLWYFILLMIFWNNASLDFSLIKNVILIMLRARCNEVTIFISWISMADAYASRLKLLMHHIISRPWRCFNMRSRPISSETLRSLVSRILNMIMIWPRAWSLCLAFAHIFNSYGLS